MRHTFSRVMTVQVLLVMGSLAHAPSAHPFHVGGVGACDSCHSMHNPKDKKAMAGEKSQSLLTASDPSSVCLNCHAGPGGGSASVFSSDGSALTPGGDFYWLTKTFTWGGGASAGDSHGHNVIARDFNLGEDLRFSQAPGGTYRAANLGCTSCHDPHGEVRGGTARGTPPVSVSGSYGEQPRTGTIRGNYRLLGDSNYGGGEAAEGFQFTYDAPVARQDSNSRFTESDFSHVDYGSGMSEWCANCHENILRNDHEGSSGGFSHPSGSRGMLSGEIASTYNSYIRTGELTGVPATAYLQFVPFERGVGDPLRLDPTSRRGPNTSSRIMCLTCHRAHASAFTSIGRWDLDAALLAESHPRPGDGGASGNDVHYSYYGRNIAVEFGAEQGPFCEKCHGIILDPLLEEDPDQFQGQDPFQLFREKRRF
jgi:hypothetical protein